MLKKNRWWLALASTAISPMPALAQNADEVAAVGEIIVTARKRAESALAVPIIETILTQDRLERLQVQDLKDLAKLAPGLSLGDAFGVVGTQVSIRGVGTSALNVGVDQSVALNVDGLQMTQGQAYASGMFDLGQVEVLKGPQALFFGKNSPGGVIAVRSADPSDRTELIARLGYEGEADETRGELILSGPVTDTLGLRVSSLYRMQEGFFRNVAAAVPGLGGRDPKHRRGPNGTNLILRGTAVWKPSAQFDARLKVNYTRDEVEGQSGQQYTSCPDGTANLLNGIPFIVGEDCRKDRNYSLVELDPAAFPVAKNGGIARYMTTLRYGSLELNYRPSDAITLTSVTGYYHQKAVNEAVNATYSAVSGPTFALENILYRNDFTQELRVNSDFDGALNFTAGAYYQDARLKHPFALEGNVALGRPVYVDRRLHVVDIKSISAFGQLRWDVAPTLEIAAGARVASEKRTLTAFRTITGAPVLFPTAVPKIKADNVSPEITVTYRPTDDFTLFGSLKRGYKSGSFNISTLVASTDDYSFGDEKVDGGEIGLKARLFDRQITTNLAGYFYRYNGLQVGASSTAVNDIPVLKTINAGKADVYGLDFDVTYQPAAIDNLTIQAAVAWNHARFKELDNVPCWGGQTEAEGCDQVYNRITKLFTAQSLSGKALVRAPSWEGTVGFNYELPVGDRFVLALANENRFSSKYRTLLGLRDDFFQEGYIKIDATIALRDAGDRWEVALIGKNLSSELTTGNCASSNNQAGSLGGQITGGTTRGIAGVNEVSCTVERGRELWVRLTLKPFG